MLGASFGELSLSAVSVWLLVCGFLALGVRALAKPPRNLPPGPVPEPLIGNVRQIPSSYSWLTYTSLAEKYGDVLYLSANRQPIVVLGSSKAITDLMVKKSAVLSGRPYLAMLGELVGWDRSVQIGAPSKTWQVQRKLLHQFLGAPSVPIYHAMIEEESRRFVQRVLPTTEGFGDDFLFTIAELTLRMTYGIKLESPDDPLAVMSEEAAVNFGAAIEFGNFRVNLFPILRYLPPWLPFAKFRRTAAEWRKHLDTTVNAPFERTKADVASGHAEPSFTARVLENKPNGVDEDHIKWAAGSLYVAAARTTRSTMTAFLLAMMMHPKVQEKAHAELTREIGEDRLPSLADRKNVPYIDHIFKEVLRWHPVTPLGLPHMTTEECQYRGWEIPKGALVYGNIWALSHDPSVYTCPNDFNPDRYEDSPDLPDPRDYAFGFGRRVCPGQAFAEAVVWSTMATLLATVHILKPLDKNGKEVEPKEDFTGVFLQ